MLFKLKKIQYGFVLERKAFISGNKFCSGCKYYDFAIFCRLSGEKPEYRAPSLCQGQLKKFNKIRSKYIYHPC
jgi:hypothetical protein